MLNYCESPSTHSGIANTQTAAAVTSPAVRSAVNKLWGSLFSGSKGIHSSWEEMHESQAQAEGCRT